MRALREALTFGTRGIRRALAMLAVVCAAAASFLALPSPSSAQGVPCTDVSVSEASATCNGVKYSMGRLGRLHFAPPEDNFTFYFQMTKGGLPQGGTDCRLSAKGVAVSS